MKKYVLISKEADSISLGADIMEQAHLKSGDEVEVHFKAGKILIKTNRPECMICGETEGLKELGNNKHICPKCAEVFNDGLTKHTF